MNHWADPAVPSGVHHKREADSLAARSVRHCVLCEGTPIHRRMKLDLEIPLTDGTVVRGWWTGVCRPCWRRRCKKGKDLTEVKRVFHTLHLPELLGST